MYFILLIAAALAAGCSAYMVALQAASLSADYRGRVRLEARLTRSVSRSGLAAYLKMLGNRLVSIPLGRKFVTELSGAGFAEPRTTALTILAVVPLALFSISILIGSVVVSVAFTAAAFAGLNLWSKSRTKKREQRLADELPALFKSIAGGLSAGFSMNQALSHASKESAGTVRTQLEPLIQQVSLGLPLDEALADLYGRVPLPELNMMIVGLTLQKQIGGNLVSFLEEVVRLIEERRLLQKNLRIETAQARTSAQVIGLMPLIAIGAISIVDPSFLRPLFVTAPGLMLLAVAALAEGAGWLLLSKISDIRI
jgi:tight adherence protein B